MLATLVEQKKLPPVSERLPTSPYVVPHPWVKSGNYGGTLQMACQSADGWGVGHFIQESMYGHSLLRWLRDGLEIGPGLVESYKANKETTEWTLNFREGLKWSDGKPFTTEDIMYWWEDIVLNEEHPTILPEELRSSKNTGAKMRAVDAQTLQITFDAPAPLLPGLLACWVKRGIGPAEWMLPKHYMRQFHPKYNKKIKQGTDWATTHDQKKDFAVNPQSPTLTGWMLESYKEGTNSVWVRNPYYWCVSREGNQLPYIDRLVMTNTQNAEVFKLRLQSGEVDYVHGGHTPLNLSDVAGLKQAQPKSKLEVIYWDSGSGTGSVFFLNQDYRDPKVREMFRNTKFRKALSHAWNRAEVRKQVYFNQGELTTGTTSPKSIEYVFNAEGKERYAEWRDSAVKYDPEMAKKLLDEIGMKPGPNGIRTLPDGSKFTLRLEYGAPGSTEHIGKNNLLARDLRAVGVDTRLSPVPAESQLEQWTQGRLMSRTDWEVSDGPNSLVNPTWMVPLEATRWAPLQGTFYSVRGTPKEKQERDTDPYKRTPPRMEPVKGGPVERLWAVYDKAKAETDALKRHRHVWEITKIHVDDGPFFTGPVANYPQIVLVGEGLMNVPRREDLPLNGYVNTWIHPTPATYDPEAYYWDNPESHT